MAINQKAVYAEFIGTLFFVYVVVNAVHSGASSVVVGLTLAAMIYWGGHISGGHFNPAVSFGFYVQQFFGGDDSFDVMNCLSYVAAQVVGGAIGAFLFNLLLDDDDHADVEHEDLDAAAMIVTEIIFTAFLVNTVLSTAASKATEGNSFFGLAIGSIVVASGAVVGNHEFLGALNPAVSIGLLIANHCSAMTLVYALIGQFLGGAYAAFSHNYLLIDNGDGDDADAGGEEAEHDAEEA